MATTINRHDKALAFPENTRQIHWPFISSDTPHLPDSFVGQANVYFSGLISLFSPQRIFHEQGSFYWWFFWRNRFFLFCFVPFSKDEHVF